MKKITPILVLIVSCFLVACTAKPKTTKPVASKSAQQSTKSSATSAKSSEPVTPSEMPSSSQTVKTSNVQYDTLTKARLTLYQAGVNSSTISDAQLLTYWDEAEQNKVDFVSYVKDKLK
ncbi:hypothetical protein [Pseudolactococcus raffinolactis]|uniref:hypothetical protein n=1 Tax=Pseudolactococcus raffinolactis TaxID=1366 RepID=UPI000BB50B1C|nr:hypothetical protein [Lactococcus raffinolactis]ATC61481.1 hypothetical protein CMV25_06210 [Lactococcus raffinolactis]